MTDQHAVILKNKQIAPHYYEMVLKFDALPSLHCGQFLNFLLPHSEDTLLRRPFGINDFDEQNNTVTFVYAVVGKGTERMTQLKVGEATDVLLPLGNGFHLKDEEKKVLILGGGAGVLPLMSVFKTYPDKEYYSYLGFRSKDEMLKADVFQSHSVETVIATDDGSFGKKGYINTYALQEIDRICPDVVLLCGPQAMYPSVQPYGKKYRILVSMEQRMGCGMGACLVCTCKTQEGDKTRQKRVCKDGPVFEIGEVVL